jgi:hypothetical protein
VKDALEDKCTLGGGIGINSGYTSAMLILRHVAGFDGLLVEPELQAPTGDEGSIVFGPVADAVVGKLAVPGHTAS